MQNKGSHSPRKSVRQNLPVSTFLFPRLRVIKESSLCKHDLRSILTISPNLHCCDAIETIFLQRKFVAHSFCFNVTSPFSATCYARGSNSINCKSSQKSPGSTIERTDRSTHAPHFLLVEEPRRRPLAVLVEAEAAASRRALGLLLARSEVQTWHQLQLHLGTVVLQADDLAHIPSK